MLCIQLVTSLIEILIKSIEKVLCKYWKDTAIVRHQIHKHNQIFTKLGSLMDIMVPHYPLIFWQIHPTDNQETGLFK